jgi:hypothetical protein
MGLKVTHQNEKAKRTLAQRSFFLVPQKPPEIAS